MNAMPVGDGAPMEIPMGSGTKTMEVKSCENCRFASGTWRQVPCIIGAYQIRQCNQCFQWKPMRWWQKKLFAMDGTDAGCLGKS